MRHKNKKSFNRRYLLAGIILILVLGAVAAALFINSSSKNASTSSQDIENISADEDEPKIDLSPATEEEQEASDQQKDAIIEQQKQQANQNSTKSSPPVITFSGYQSSNNSVQVGAFVPGIVEDGGSCKLSATKDGQTVTSTSTGVRNASNTNCTFSVPRDKFPSSGSWTIAVSYSSASIQTGNSQNQKVVVP